MIRIVTRTAVVLAATAALTGAVAAPAVAAPVPDPVTVECSGPGMVVKNGLCQPQTTVDLGNDAEKSALAWVVFGAAALASLANPFG